MTILGTIKRRLRTFFVSETVLHRGQTLPSRNLRFGGVHFQDNEAFLSAGERDARRLIEWCNLTEKSAIMDVGCGTGRLAIGIMSVLKTIRRYEGVDVSPTAVEWCTRHLTPAHPAFRFTLINVQNERYNPAGGARATDFRLPFDDGSFDVIQLYSVFSHMRSPDVRSYLREFARLLTPQGSVFLTAFTEEGVADEEENPQNYIMEWKGALHCVRFSDKFFRQMVEEAGLKIARTTHQSDTDGQSALLLTR
ncbi:MAG: class I SAM-dependent methyltransferase [Candidatus Peribacteraceae bacterium]|nr:class I SAM-dependent methyltransferase [Candidatus Peribacteraceae bacterium]MDD5075246.1 class I SAM-dependent methyltransferase [Candidatus Peribacteraceae bacterium]